MIETRYNANLQAGLGMIEETNVLLDHWDTGMSHIQLSKVAVESGLFPSMGARRVKNFVSECFAPRYLATDDEPATTVKQLRTRISSKDLKQAYLIHTTRANRILGDFVRQVYWPYYAGGKTEIQTSDAVDFVVRSNQDGKTRKMWSESTVRRVASYLTGCCADFGLLESGTGKSTRQFIPFHLSKSVALYLSHDLHFSGLGDNAVVGHEDWQLFGLEKLEVIEKLKSISLDGHYLIQSAGGVVNIGWKYNNMQEAIDAIGQ